MSYIDAESEEVLVRDGLVDLRPTTRPGWCSPTHRRSTTRAPTRACAGAGPTPPTARWWSACQHRPPAAWDVDARRNPPTFTTRATQRSSPVHNWNSSDPFTVGTERATPRPDREYDVPVDQPVVARALQPGHVHLAAAQRHRRRPGQPVRHAQPDARLVVPPRLHRGDLEHAGGQLRRGGGLGGDPEQGNAQAGGISGGPPGVRGPQQRQPDHAAPTASPPITNMYLWQPIAGAFYAPCVDGDYDMSVIGHEYTHAITNRMIAGPNAGCRGFQAAGRWARAGPT